MKLYQFEWGIYPRRVHIYLREKGIEDLEMIEIDVLSAENRAQSYTSKNPIGTIPTLETGSGDFVCQSTSILLHLEKRFPLPNMMGESSSTQDRTLDQLAVINEAYNLAGLCTFYGSPLFAERRKPSNEVARAMRSEFHTVLRNLELLSGDGDYFGGRTPSLADVAFFASEQFMRELYQLQLPPKLSRLEEIYQRFDERPSAMLAPYPGLVAELAPLRAF